MFVVVVDAPTKWLEVFRKSQVTSQAAILAQERVLASYDMPEQIVTNNATTFTSDEFQTFAKSSCVH